MYVVQLEYTFHIPAHLLVMIDPFLKNCALLYHTLDGRRRICVTSEATQGSFLGLERWDYSCGAKQRPRWTVRLIANIRPWTARKHEELTQPLSGYGYFRRYIQNMGKVDTPNYFQSPRHRSILLLPVTGATLSCIL